MMQVLINPIIAICVMICFLALLICITINNVIGKIYKYQIRKNGLDNRITRKEVKNLQRVLDQEADGILGGYTLGSIQRAHRNGCPMTLRKASQGDMLIPRDHVGVFRWEDYGYKKVREYEVVDPGGYDRPMKIVCKEKICRL